MGNSSSSVSIRSSGSGSSRLSKKFERPLPPSESKNARLVLERWCNAFNRHDLRMIKRFASTDSMFMFKGAEAGMPLVAFLDEIDNLCRSFPDNRMRWDSIEEIEPGKVKVTNFVGRATHTGEPFGFGPFPRIPATGIVVEEDPCDLYITVQGGKMTRFIVDSSGDIVGPPGYYQKIGGKYTMGESTPASIIAQ